MSRIAEIGTGIKEAVSGVCGLEACPPCYQARDRYHLLCSGRSTMKESYYLLVESPMPIFEIAQNQIRKLSETTFGDAGLRERGDLQRLLRNQIDVIAPDTLVVADEFGEWEESKRRIDLLAVDKEANLVVIELKRTEDGGHMELQAIRYAAMVSTMTFEKVVEVFGGYLARIGEQQDARARLLEFLEWEEPDEDRFAQDVRIILVSADFSRELTTAVMWLNERNLDIRCIRIKPYADDDRLLIDVQQVIPLPEAAEYQVQIREKERRELQDRSGRLALRKKFWQGLLALAATKSPVHANRSPTEEGWVSGSTGIRGLAWVYVIHEHECRVELYIDRGAGETETNKRIFDGLTSSRDEIDRAFGTALKWERLDGKQACRVSFTITAGGYRDEGTWPQIFDQVVDAMCRLEKSFGSHLARIKAEM